MSEVQKMFPIGRMVWAKLPTWCWWPGHIYSYGKEGMKKERVDPEDLDKDDDQQKIWVSWYGEKQLSLVSRLYESPF